MEEPTFTAIDYKRIWINPEDMMRIGPLLKGGDRIWMEGCIILSSMR